MHIMMNVSPNLLTVLHTFRVHIAPDFHTVTVISDSM